MSTSTCRYAPCTLMEPSRWRESTHAEAALASRPITAITIIGAVSTGCGSRSLRTASTTIQTEMLNTATALIRAASTSTRRLP